MTPTFPSRSDVEPGTNALVVDDRGVTALRYEESSTDDGCGWIERWHREHGVFERPSLADGGLEPPVLGEFSVAIEIDVSQERAFEYVADVETHPEYADFVERVDIVSAATCGEDVVFEQIHEGSTDVHETEFVIYEPHDRLGWVTHKADSDLRINYWFESTNTGTRVVHSGIGWLAADSATTFEADLAALLERYENNEIEMANLQAILEDES